MNHINALLGIGVKQKIKDPPNIDKMSIEYFKGQDLSRDRFSYDVLLDIGLWPDDILVFLEVLRISYSDFINTYSLQANIFDEPIRNITWFMNQRNYNKLPWVVKYLRNGQYEIPDGYLNCMIAEDNCYMRELEDRKRSDNESKHYYLFKAILDLLSHKDLSGDINVGDIKLSKEYEDKLRLYVCIYALKITYCIVDDTCRMMLSTSLTGEKKGINMAEFVGDMIIDIDERILSHLKIVHDRKMYTKFYTFRDILTYIHYVSLSFNHTFKSKKDPRLGAVPLGTLATPGAPSPAGISLMGRLQPSIIFEAETISRAESVFKYFLSILSDHHRKSHEILEGNTNIEDIMKKDRSSLTSIQVPMYNVVWTTTDDGSTDIKVEKIFSSTPRSTSPREDDLKTIAIKDPKEKRKSVKILSEENMKKEQEQDAKTFQIDLSRITPRTYKKSSIHRKYSTDIISLTPRKE